MLNKVFPRLVVLLLCATQVGLAAPVFSRGAYIPHAGMWPVLGDGDDSPAAVRSLQYLLRSRGLPVAVDGRFGEQTGKQVALFQKRKFIIASYRFGIADAWTWEWLICDVKRGDKGWAVYAVQNLLREKGYKVALDGKFGVQTEKAVRQFQEKEDMLHGVIPPGTVEHFTWCELVGGRAYSGGGG